MSVDVAFDLSHFLRFQFNIYTLINSMSALSTDDNEHI